MRIQKRKKKKIKEDFITSNVKAITDSEENLLVQQIGFVIKKKNPTNDIYCFYGVYWDLNYLYLLLNPKIYQRLSPKLASTNI